MILFIHLLFISYLLKLPRRRKSNAMTKKNMSLCLSTFCRVWRLKLLLFSGFWGGFYVKQIVDPVSCNYMYFVLWQKRTTHSLMCSIIIYLVNQKQVIHYLLLSTSTLIHKFNICKLTSNSTFISVFHECKNTIISKVKNSKDPNKDKKKNSSLVLDLHPSSPNLSFLYHKNRSTDDYYFI